MTTPLVLHIDDELRHRLYWLAEVTDRSLPYLITEALQQYIETNEWQIRAIEEHFAVVDAGRDVERGTQDRGWNEDRQSE